jgi:hypothetical protein
MSLFFDDASNWIDVTLNSDPVVIQVLPLPTNNVPPDFNGAVGRYTFTARVSTNTVTAGDPITLTLQIAGQGPIESLNLPAPSGWRDFKTYPPLAKVETTDEFGLVGSKTFEQVIIPETAEVHAIPALTFSFFDPEKRTYQTLSRPATPITVRPATALVAQPTIVAGARAAPGAPSTSTNIVHIKSRPGVLAQIQPPLLQQPWFILLQAAPLTAWLAALAWRHRQTTLLNNPRLRRRREVARRVQEGLGELERLGAANQSEAFFALVFRLLQEQLGERLDLPASAITEAVVDERLRPAGVPEQTLELLRGLFQSCNQARYGPLRTGPELASLTSDLRTALRLLQQADISHGG